MQLIPHGVGCSDQEEQEDNHAEEDVAEALAELARHPEWALDKEIQLKDDAAADQDASLRAMAMSARKTSCCVRNRPFAWMWDDRPAVR